METAACGRKDISDSKPWFVLVAMSPERVEYRLLKRNMHQEELMSQEPDARKRQEMQRFLFRLFVPYTAMESNKEDDASLTGITLRSALHRYLFVSGDENLLKNLMVEWNNMFADKFFFLKDGSKNIAKIRQSDIDKLCEACLCDQSKIVPDLSLYHVKKGDTVRLVNTPFANDDCLYEVVEVTPKQDGSVELKVKMRMFGLDFDNISVTYNDPLSYDSKASKVSVVQKKLLDIFRRRVNGKETDVSRYEDQKALVSIITNDDILFHDGAMKRHYLALMLMCVHLQGDEARVKQYGDEVTKELAVLARLRESKAATDTRAYLHISLYIATGEPKYREMAKNYVRKYDPSSPYLRQFVSTMSKREAGKWIGQKGRNVWRKSQTLHPQIKP